LKKKIEVDLSKPAMSKNETDTMPKQTKKLIIKKVEVESDDEEEKELKILQEKITLLQNKKEQKKKDDAMRQYKKEKDERWEEVKEDLIVEEVKRQQELMKQVCEKAGICEEIYNLGVSFDEGGDNFQECERIVNIVKEKYYAVPKKAPTYAKKSAGGGEAKEGKRRPPTKVVRDLATLFSNNPTIYHKSGDMSIWCAKYNVATGEIILEGVGAEIEKKNELYTKIIKGQSEKNIGEIVKPKTIFKNLNQFICGHNSIYAPEKVQKQTAYSGCIYWYENEKKVVLK
jgi:hypothetical protein